MMQLMGSYQSISSRHARCSRRGVWSARQLSPALSRWCVYDLASRNEARSAPAVGRAASADLRRWLLDPDQT